MCLTLFIILYSSWMNSIFDSLWAAQVIFFLAPTDVLTRFGWLVFMSALPQNEWLLKEQLNNNEPQPCSAHFSHLPQWAHEVSLKFSSSRKNTSSFSISLFRNIRQSWFFCWPYWALWDGNGHDLQCLGENTSPLKSTLRSILKPLEMLL